MAVINVFEAGARLGSPASRASNVRPENSGQMAGARADAALAGTAVNAMAKFQEQMQVADVMAANNEYNLRMGELKNELMQNKEQKAGDNGRLYEEGRQKIIESIMRKGPQTLRFGAGQKAFMNTVDRDWVGQKNAMDAYMLQEGERYQDTQLNNQLLDTVKAAVTDFGDDELLAQAERRIEFMGAARYANYGSEKIKAFMNKASAAIYDAAAGAAINSGDYSRAGELLQAYGYKMSPGTRMKLDKLVQERKKSDDELNSFAELYNKYGDDTEAAIGAMKNNAGTINTGAGMEWAQGQIGQQLGVNQCANFAGEVVAHAGGDTSINSSLADGMYLKAQRKGYTFTDRSALKDGDLVFWSVNGSGYEASDDEADVESGTKAYKGITHVGVYDAKTGKVIQSGTHGVSAMDMDAAGYHVVGFARAGGRAKSPTEQAAEEKAYITYVNNQKARKRMADDARFDSWSKDITGWVTSGISYDEAIKNARQLAGSDVDMLSKAMSAVNTVYGIYGARPSNSGGTGSSSGRVGGGLPPGAMNTLDDMLEQGRFASKEEFSDFVAMYGANKSEYNTALDKYDDWNSGEGSFAYKWNDIKEQVLSDAKLEGAEKERVWNGVRARGKFFINDFERKNNRKPTDYEVIAACRDALLEQNYGNYDAGGWFANTDLNLTSADLALAGIRNVERASNGMLRVYYMDGREANMNSAGLAAVMGR